MPHYLLTYELGDDYLDRRIEYRAAHLGLAWAAVEAGELVLGGAVGDPVESALLVFNDADAARRFAEADPYVTGKIVTSFRIRPWATVVGAEAATPLRIQDIAPE